MKRFWIVWLVWGISLGMQAVPHTGLGYRRGKMNWSHLGPRPEVSASSAQLKRSSLAGDIEKGSYPRQYDLRKIGVVTPVKDQEPYGCCWAFAACGSLESFLKRAWGAEYDFSERNLALVYGNELDPDLDEHGFGLIDMGGDTSFADAYFLRWAGPVLEADDPYPEKTTPALKALEMRFGDFFSNTLAQTEIEGEKYFDNPALSLEFLANLDLDDDWPVVDREAAQAGFGAHFRTNFIHVVKVLDEYGRRVSVPHINRELIPDATFANCPDRQGPWNVPVHVQGCWRLPPRASALDNATYKYALMKQGAISVAYHQDSDYRTVLTNAGEELVAYYCPEKGAQPNHQVLLVGWDDDFPASHFGTSPLGNGAFLIKNSWGEGDDAGGYFWISYYDEGLARAKGDVASVYSRVDSPSAAENYDYVHSYDTLGLGCSRGVGKTSATAANMFTAVRPEYIRAVGTYLLQWNTKYTVKIYTGCTAGKPTSGVLAHTQSGTREFPGYETIDLSTPIPVASGERYSVVVTLTTPEYKKPIPMQLDDTTGFRYSRKKCSYLREANGSWTDLVAAYNPKKAFTEANSPKTFCCKVYGDERLATAFDGDAKEVYTVKLADGSVLTVTISAASKGICSASAKIVKKGKTTATYPARSISVEDGFVILKSASGKDLWLSLEGDEASGNVLSIKQGNVELTGVKSVNPNITGYEVGSFRVGVAAVGDPIFANATGKDLTWSAKNLPAGVTINAKTGRLAGAPTAAVKTAKTARIYATAVGGGSDSFAFSYTVDALDGWAQGTKTGGGETSAFTFTVGKTGKVSGKLFLGNTNWTFSASYLTSYAEEDGAGCYHFAGKAKYGTRTLPIAVDVAPMVLTNCTDDIPTLTVGVASGTTSGGDLFVAQANVWSRAPYTAYAKVLASAPALTLRADNLLGLGAKETVKLKFSKSGKVIAAGSFAGVKNKRATTYKPSLSTLLIPASTQEDGAFRAQVFPWFAANATYRFKGFAAQVDLLWDDFRFLCE